jgi:hypothetical protein
MNEIIPDTQFKSLLESAEQADIVIDYVLIDCEAAEINAETHQQAAIFALQILAKKLDEYFTLLVQERNGKRDDFFQIKTNPEKSRGERISLEHFLGRAYDMQQQKIVSVWNENTDGSRVSKTGSTQGYAEAFSDTPYNVQMKLEDINTLFEDINNAAFDGLRQDLEVYEWSNDWSTYFDAGNEWWGSFLWTVKHPTQNVIVAIGASTTD